MQAQRLETTDIFKSAVFLCNGGRLAGVRLKQRQRGIVSFMIEGDGILQVWTWTIAVAQRRSTPYSSDKRSIT